MFWAPTTAHFPFCPPKIGFLEGVGGGGLEIFFLLLSFFLFYKKDGGEGYENLCSRQWGSSLPGLRTQEPPLSPPSMLAEIFRHMFLQSNLKAFPPTNI